jgi:sortase A
MAPRTAAAAPDPNSPLVSAVPAGPGAAIIPRPPQDPLVGLLSIPRLGYSEAVAEGDDAATLRVAIGHLPDTAVPWIDGNTALAGHRDTLFRSLAKIRVGDELALSTAHGDFRYRVSQTLIVDPDDVWVLAPAPGRQLTLITCYPFHYIGSAPHRFIVRAEPIETDPARASDP